MRSGTGADSAGVEKMGLIFCGSPDAVVKEVCLPSGVGTVPSGRPVSQGCRGAEYWINAWLGAAVTDPLRRPQDPVEFLDRRQAPITMIGETAPGSETVTRTPGVQTIQEHGEGRPVRIRWRATPGEPVHVAVGSRANGILLLPHKACLAICNRAIAIVDESRVPAAAGVEDASCGTREGTARKAFCGAGLTVERAEVAIFARIDDAISTRCRRQRSTGQLGGHRAGILC